MSVKQQFEQWFEEYESRHYIPIEAEILCKDLAHAAWFAATILKSKDTSEHTPTHINHDPEELL